VCRSKQADLVVVVVVVSDGSSSWGRSSRVQLGKEGARL
jgi:hypothetical protein